jgi:hypothetical protein
MNSTADRAFRDALGEMKHHRKEMYSFSPNQTAEMQRVEQNAALCAETMKKEFGIDLDDPMQAHVAYSTISWLMAQLQGMEEAMCRHHVDQIDTIRMLGVVESGNAIAEAVYSKHGRNAPDWCPNCGQGSERPQPENP